jgi:hypothetical protein
MVSSKPRLMTATSSPLSCSAWMLDRHGRSADLEPAAVRLLLHHATPAVGGPAARHSLARSPWGSQLDCPLVNSHVPPSRSRTPPHGRPHRRCGPLAYHPAGWISRRCRRGRSGRGAPRCLGPIGAGCGRPMFRTPPPGTARHRRPSTRPISGGDPSICRTPKRRGSWGCPPWGAGSRPPLPLPHRPGLSGPPSQGLPSFIAAVRSQAAGPMVQLPAVTPALAGCARRRPPPRPKFSNASSHRVLVLRSATAR